MSDTPKIDAACGWPIGQHGRISSSDLQMQADGPFVHANFARELERENAALRTDKERLDWLFNSLGYDFALWNVNPAKHAIEGCTAADAWRAAIDAARKEAKP